MAQSEANRVSLRISRETVFAETPATPTMARQPFVSDTLVHNKKTVQSNVLRSDRQRDALVQVGVDANGDIAYELRFTDLLPRFEEALCGTYAVQSTTGAGTSNNFGFAAAGGGVQVITGPAAWTTNYLVGAYVRIKLATNPLNNGIFRITAKDSTTMTVNNATGASESNSVAVIAQKCLRNGTTKRSLLIEKAYEDLASTFLNFKGMRCAGFSMAITAEEIITITFKFMGKAGDTTTATVSGSLTAAAAEDSMNASLNVGSVMEGGVSLTTALRYISLELDNGLRNIIAVASVGPRDINMGSVNVSGRVDAYFENLTMLDKAIDHTPSDLAFRATDPLGNAYVFTIGRLFFSGSPPTPGINQDTMLPLDYVSSQEPVNNFTVQVDALAI